MDRGTTAPAAPPPRYGPVFRSIRYVRTYYNYTRARSHTYPRSAHAQKLQWLQRVARNLPSEIQTKIAHARIPLARKFKMSFSMETRRTSPYSDDLRWRMIWQKEALGLSSSEVATRLGVDPTTVRRIIRKFKRTGNVGKEKYPVRLHPLRKLSLPIQFCIADLVLQRPGIYINELQHHILQHHGEQISSSTICRFLHSAGFTRQRLRIAASQRDDVARANFAAEVSMYKPEMLIFLDKTGSDRRNCIRREGYSIRGRPLVSRKFLSRGTRINSIAFISVCGVLDCKTYKHTVDGETFYNFVQSSLLPHLMPFDGHNPHSVVIMDNCAIHHVSGIREMIEEVGALLLYLPPYSPDFNPIEEAFPK